MEQIAIPRKPQSQKQLPTAQQQLFVGVFISLSWQLLIVVLVPFIGGHYIDQKTNSTPLFTLIGLFIALGGFGLLTYRAYQALAQAQKSEDTDD